MNLKKNTKLIIFIYLIMLAGGLVISFFSGIVPDSKQYIIAFPPDSFTPDMGIQMVELNDLQPYIYETTFKREQLQNHDGDIGILITRFTSSGYRLFLNDCLIGQKGSMEKGNANLWNDASFFGISSTKIDDENVIRIESIADYKTGLTTHPIYVMTTDHGLAFQRWFAFFNSDIIHIGIGFLVLGAILLIILNIMPDNRDRLLIYLSIAMISMAVYIYDYTSFEYLPFSYFVYKKIIMISFWVSSLFIGVSIYKLLKSKAALLISFIGFIGIVLISFLSPTIIDFKKAYDIWYLSQIINIITWLIVSLRVYRKNIEARILFIGYFVLFIFALINFYVNSIGKIFSMNSPVIYIAVLSIMPLMLAYFDYTQKT
ncbi:MAG: hypothetical protein JXQ23_07000, partial [Clostridia bacterium]|nr:hypothetical protein [Clostridia bacterium]